ncbi:hypothetical protein F5Y03DRAFT_399707 [Xylaria venustula]|nr:hypothetical protein F5Y03DRAFT_399707 [Xylaria venustula]
MSTKERDRRLQCGELKLRNEGRFTIPAPDSVKVPHHGGRPLGNINKLDPTHQTNLMSYEHSSTGISATIHSREDFHKFVDLYHELEKPKPGAPVVVTARQVPYSVQAKQARLSAGKQGKNPAIPRVNMTDRPVRPSLEKPMSGRGGHSLGGRVNRRSRPNKGKKPAVQGRVEKLEELDREMDEYQAQAQAQAEAQRAKKFLARDPNNPCAPPAPVAPEPDSADFTENNFIDDA